MTTSQAASESQQPSTKTVRLVIKGRVQGVFYRNWTIDNATQLGLKGWVRNKRDGSVETLLSGDSDAVQEMEERCRHDPPSAMVTALEVYPSDDDPGSGFERRQTNEKALEGKAESTEQERLRKDADKYCKTLKGKLSRRSGCKTLLDHLYLGFGSSDLKQIVLY